MQMTATETELTTKMNVSLELNRLEQWLEFNSLDVADVDVHDLVMAESVSKKPKLSDEQKSILARQRDKYVHKDKQVADVVEETCDRMAIFTPRDEKGEEPRPSPRG